MKCWWPDIKYIGCGDYVPGMVEGSDGDYVLVDDHLAEVRQAQRRMIAALYWRAGEAACDVADYVACGPDAEDVALLYATEGAAFITAAVRMEAAL